MTIALALAAWLVLSSAAALLLFSGDDLPADVESALRRGGAPLGLRIAMFWLLPSSITMVVILWLDGWESGLPWPTTRRYIKEVYADFFRAIFL